MQFVLLIILAHIVRHLLRAIIITVTFQAVGVTCDFSLVVGDGQRRRGRRGVLRHAKCMTRLLWALGPRGRLLANRLAAAEGGKNRVLVLEAGGSDLYPWVHIPIGYVCAQNNPRLCWCFSTVEQPGLNGRAIGYPRGRVVGGCSSITGMIYQRGQVGDYDIWAEATVDSSWAWENFQRHFDGVLDSGEWTVSRQRVRWDMLDDFCAGR